MSRRRTDPSGGCGCLLVGLVAWLVIVGSFTEPIAGPNYPEGLFYGIAAVPVLLLLWMMKPSKR